MKTWQYNFLAVGSGVLALAIVMMLMPITLSLFKLVSYQIAFFFTAFVLGRIVFRIAGVKQKLCKD